MKLPYKLEIVPDTEESGFIASYSELPGCLTCGETVTEAVANAEDEKKEWLRAAIEGNIFIIAQKKHFIHIMEMNANR